MRNMEGQNSRIDELIKYLFRVSNGVELTQESKIEKEKFGEYTKEDVLVRSQDFFIMPKELDTLIEEWLVGFTNQDQLNKTLKFKLKELKKISFSKGKEPFFLVKSLSSHSNLILSKKSHNNYSHLIHSHLINVFEERIGVNKIKEKNKITIRDKKIYNLVKILNLKIDFLRDDILPNDFILVLIRQSDKNIHLNIDNGSFHYLLTKLKGYFYNFSITSVARTNKIYSSKGTLLIAKSLGNSKSDNPKLKVEIDRFFKKFE
ncbi:MAG: hypothetical protein HON74_02695 [Flavobacteriaceae bacterium]|nr:hypothetical protein [Flavobacteriaceae bacterium]